MVLITVIFIFVVEAWGLDVITNDKDCSKIHSQTNCGRVLGCYWEGGPANTSQGGGANDIAIAGGHCMKDQCLKIVNVGDNCGSFTYYENTRTCNSRIIQSPEEHTCRKNDDSMINDIDCNAPCSGNCGPCQNLTTTTQTDWVRICYWNPNPQIGCALHALIGGSCSPGEKQFVGKKEWFNCKEFDIEGVSACLEVSGCEAVGVDACTYDPKCMIVDGQCVTDTCYYDSSFDINMRQCSKWPDICTGHIFQYGWYEYTYQSENTTNNNSPPFNYMSYKREYYDVWHCTNKNYNPQPNKFAFLHPIIGGKITAPVPFNFDEILNYKFAGEDRCVAGVSRDACNWCPEFKNDNSECTEAGGHIVTVNGENKCSDNRPFNEDAASVLYSPSITLLFALFLAAFVFLN